MLKRENHTASKLLPASFELRVSRQTNVRIQGYFITELEFCHDLIWPFFLDNTDYKITVAENAVYGYLGICVHCWARAANDAQQKLLQVHYRREFRAILLFWCLHNEERTNCDEILAIFLR